MCIRDRFEPKLIPKYQRGISGIEEKVISLYARGMSTRDIPVSYTHLDALLVSRKVEYEDVWDLRNAGDLLETRVVVVQI